MGEFSLSHLQTWNRSRIRRRRSGFRRNRKVTRRSRILLSCRLTRQQHTRRTHNSTRLRLGFIVRMSATSTRLGHIARRRRSQTPWNRKLRVWWNRNRNNL